MGILRRMVAMIALWGVFVKSPECLGQPTPNVDLGVLTNPSTTNGTLVGFFAGQVQWIRFIVPADATLGGTGYLDIDTNGGTLTTGDSHIGLYRADGVFLDSNDDSGPGLYSMLSYGRTTPSRPGLVQTGNANAVGNVHAGASGAADILAGTYYLAVTGFGGNTYGAGFAVGTTHTRTGSVAFRIDYVGNVASTPPSCTLSLVPSAGTEGTSVVATATVTPGTGPTSTGLGVNLDATAINDGFVTLFDNGIGPDVVAGDNVFSGNVTVGLGAALGVQTLSSTVSDAQGRSSACAANFTVLGPPPANDECASAQMVTAGTIAFDSSSATTSAELGCGSIGNDLWYVYTSPGTGQITVETCAQTSEDTVVGVYDSCGGSLLACNDDACGLQSQVVLCATAGQSYFVRVGGFAGARWAGTFTLTFNGTVTPTLGLTASPACGGPGTAVVLLASLNNPGCPAGTITSVSANAGVIDASTVPLLDDGVAPDVTAGDGIFTGATTVGAGAGSGNITATANLSPGGSVSQNAFFTVPYDEAGDTLSTAAPYTGGGTISGIIADPTCGANDSDVYIIGISNPTNFSASTVGGAAFDTQLFLFDSSGIGVTANDDDPISATTRSRLTNAFIPLTPGLYYLAITAYNRDPLDSGSALIWNNAPFNVERSPDGPGAANPLASWDTGATGSLGGPYTITLSGASQPAKVHECLVGWLGMDDVCPSASASHDYAKGAANASFSTNRPKGIQGEFVNHAAEFIVGQNSYIDLNNSTRLLDFPGGGTSISMTLMAWVSPYMGNSGTLHSLPIIDSIRSGTRGYQFYLDWSGTNWIPTLAIALGGGSIQTVASVLPVPASLPSNRQWSHVAASFSFDAGTGNLSVRFEVRDPSTGATLSDPRPVIVTTSGGAASAISPRVGQGVINGVTYEYSGGMDELQVYNCALDDGEVTEIQAAGSAGVEKVKVFAPWETASKGASTTNITGVLISEWDPDIMITYSPGASTGPGTFCSRAGFPGTTITPATMLGVGREVRTFQISVPGTSSRFTGHACYTIYATNMTTGATTSHMGSIVDHPIWWADLKPISGNDGFKQVPLLGSASWTFRLRNDASPGRTISYKFEALRSDMSPGHVPITLALAGGGTGNPVLGTATVGTNSTIDLPVITATMNHEEGTGAIYEIVLFADIDGSSTITAYEDIASAAMMASMSPFVPNLTCDCHGTCVADFDDGSGLGVPDEGVTIDDLLYYLSVFEAGLPCGDVDDGSGTGTPDGGVTIDDLLYYLFRFESGC